MTGQIVELTKSNIGSLAQLYVDVFSAPPWDVAWSLAAATERLTSFTEFPRFIGLGHIQENKPVAFVMGWGERWSQGWVFHIKEMGVALAVQRSGVGRELLTKFEQNLAAADFVSIYLETGTNTPARKFYEDCGYGRLDLVSLHKQLHD
jgi:ribosomal protein S18 acetylase RimI-like enzyme